jgi:peroxiredoxin
MRPPAAPPRPAASAIITRRFRSATPSSWASARTGSPRQFKTKYNLPFTLLVDEDHKVAEAYGVWGLKQSFGKTYYGVVRSHFVIDEEGRLADVQVKVSPDDSVARALEAISA